MSLFSSNILSIYGNRGDEWLNSIPKLINDLANRLNLTDLKPLPNLTYHYVVSGFQGSTPIILKLGLDVSELKREAQALKCFQNHGAVKLKLEEEGLLLLERALPGISLKTYIPQQDLEALNIACKVMKELHRAQVLENHNFPHVKDWLSAVDKAFDMPSNYLQKARDLRNKLLDNKDPNVLLHGDLHHDNIIQDGNVWKVIDPKGVIGHPLNEVWAFIKDAERDSAFISKFFGFDVQQVRDWYFVHLILAACWNLEDNIDSSFFLTLAAQAYNLTSC